ncbi:MAG: hypothetical protein R3F56_04175 [Planctomycetota bacterium]
MRQRGLRILLVGSLGAFGVALRPQSAPSAMTDADAPRAMAPVDPVWLPREVLALSARVHDDIARVDVDPIHQMLELPLQYLGLVVRRHNVQDGEPPDLDGDVTRAVLTWFDGNDAEIPWLLPWLQRQRSRCPSLRIVHFGDLGPLEADPDAFAAWMAGLGFAYEPGFTDDPLRIDVTFHNRPGTHFESPPDRRRVHYGPRSADRNHQVWVTTHDRVRPGDDRTPVVVGTFGGLALSPWTLREGTKAEDRRWHLDPFAFFRAALATDELPAPDPTVAFGRRLFLLHVDGDGFESTSTTRAGELSARVFLDEVIDRWKIPMTVSVIVAGLTDDLNIATPNERMLLAREILARPWVEPASHSVLHPLNWRRRLTKSTPPRVVTWYAPIAHYEHDMTAEVTRSIEFVDRWLLQGGRRCSVMLWSGMANPTDEALEAAGRLGCTNLNGGVCRFDASSDSVGYVSPWGRRTAHDVQVYCGAANENVFDGFFTTLPSVFRHVDTTIDRTGTPRILKPANVYVHFYSAERPARLQALQGLLARWVDREPTLPVHASTYARAVQSVLSARLRIARTAQGYVLEGLGDCRCVRLADPRRRLDWARCQGVVGCRVLQDALYVQVGAERAVIALADDDVTPRPHVEESDHRLDDVELTAHGVRLHTQSFRPRRVVLAGFTPGAALTARVGGAILPMTAAEDGRCTLELPAGDDLVEVAPR